MNRYEVDDIVIEAMTDYLENLDQDDLIAVWNEYTEDSCHDEDRIYPMWELDELMSGLNFSEALSKIDTDNFDFNDEFLYDSIYGLRSTDDLDDVIEIDYIIDHVIYEDGDFREWYPELKKVGDLFREALALDDDDLDE